MSIPEAITPANIRLWLLDIYGANLSSAQKAYAFIDLSKTHPGTVSRMRIVGAMPLSPDSWDEALQFLEAGVG